MLKHKHSLYQLLMKSSVFVPHVSCFISHKEFITSWKNVQNVDDSSCTRGRMFIVSPVNAAVMSWRSTEECVAHDFTDYCWETLLSFLPVFPPLPSSSCGQRDLLVANVAANKRTDNQQWRRTVTASSWYKEFPCWLSRGQKITWSVESQRRRLRGEGVGLNVLYMLLAADCFYRKHSEAPDILSAVSWGRSCLPDGC